MTRESDEQFLRRIQREDEASTAFGDAIAAEVERKSRESREFVDAMVEVAAAERSDAKQRARQELRDKSHIPLGEHRPDSASVVADSRREGTR